MKFNVIVMQNKQLHIYLFKKVFLFILLAKQIYITQFYEKLNTMKRLLLKCLFGCILIGQSRADAGDLIIPAKTWQFVTAGVLTTLPALCIRAEIVAQENVAASSRSELGNILRWATLEDRMKFFQFNKIALDKWCLEGEYSQVNPYKWQAFHKQERTNRWTAAFFAAMFAAGIARLSANYLPDNVRDFIVRSCSMSTATGIAVGAGIPLWFILPHLTHACRQKDNGTFECDADALKRKYYPDASGQTYSPW
jgi:hypothetical protein